MAWLRFVPHFVFCMEISQVCKVFSFAWWSYAAFKAHLRRFRACFDAPCICSLWHKIWDLILVCLDLRNLLCNIQPHWLWWQESICFLFLQGVCFQLALPISVPKRKTAFSQPKLLFHDILHLRKPLIGSLAQAISRWANSRIFSFWIYTT